MERNCFEVVYNLRVLYLDDIKSNSVDTILFLVPEKNGNGKFSGFL